MILSPVLRNEPPSGLPFSFHEGKARELARMLTLGVDTAEELGRFYELDAVQTRTLITSGYFRALLAEAQDELRDCNTVLEKTKAMARLATPEALMNLINLGRQTDDFKVAKDASESVLNLAGLATKAQNAPPAGMSQQNGIALSITFTSAPARQSSIEGQATVVQSSGGFPALRIDDVDDAC